MYCTIAPETLSTGIGEDATFAYYRLRSRARTLGTISHSFDVLAASATSGYFAALADPSCEAWSAFVGRTALLVEHAASIDDIVTFDRAEREALDYFAAIVRENADLLGNDGPKLPRALAGAAPYASEAAITVQLGECNA